MKRIVPFILFVVLSWAVYAQSYVGGSPDTITAENNVLQIGDSITFVNVFGADNFNPGDTGEAVIWDFSNYVEIPDSLEIYHYVDTDSVPDDFHVPNTSTLAEIMEGMDSSAFYYRNTDGNGNPVWYRTGFFSAENGLLIWADYDQDLQLYDYPFTYGSSFSTTYQASEGAGSGWAMPSYGIQDNLTIDNGSLSYDVDGWGILITPYKTYKNVLRMHENETFDMTLLLYGSAFVTSHFNDNSYFWFSPQYKGYVMKYIISHYEDSQNNNQTIYYLAWRKERPDTLDVDFVANDTLAQTYIDTITLYNISSPIMGTNFSYTITPSTYEFVDTLNGIHPRVIFTAPGDYTITLEGSNDSLGTAQETKTDYIHVEEAPRLIAGFYAEPTEVDVNGIVIMHNTTNHIDGTTWLWQVSPGSEGNQWGFVDFTSSTDFEPHIQFYTAGCYSIRLVATNDQYYNSPDDTIRMNYINVGGGCGDAYNITFNVVNQNNEPIENATVNVTGVGSHTTDNNGQATFSLYNGNYNYTVSADGYADTSGTFTVSDADAEVNVVLRSISTFTSDISKIKIYPNPADDLLFVSAPENTEFAIYDLNGRMVLNKVNISGKSVFDISFLPAGIYQIRLNTANGVITQKLIKR